MRYSTVFRCATTALLAVAALTGCSGTGFVLGPFEAVQLIATGALGPGDFPEDAPALGFITEDIPVCDNFSVDVIQEMVRDQINESLRDRFVVTEVLLREIVITATEGSLGRVGRVDVSYLPPATAGFDPVPLHLGSATSALGFDEEIRIEMDDDFNVLDAAPAEEREDEADCPIIRFDIFGRPLDESVEFTIEAVVDIYGEIGI